MCQAAQAAGLPAERCFGTVGQAVAAVESDAVALAVPSPLHAALCAEALQAGRHVLVEKLFTVEFADAQALCLLAEGRGLRLMVSQNYRYMGLLIALRDALAGGVIGPPEYVALSFDCLWPPRPYQREMRDPMLLEMAIHHLDALRFVLGAEAASCVGAHLAASLVQLWRGHLGGGPVQLAPGGSGGLPGSLESPGCAPPGWACGALWAGQGRCTWLILAPGTASTSAATPIGWNLSAPPTRAQTTRVGPSVARWLSSPPPCARAGGPRAMARTTCARWPWPTRPAAPQPYNGPLR